MKKIFSLILCFSLLLSSCSLPKQKEKTSTEEETAVLTKKEDEEMSPEVDFGVFSVLVYADSFSGCAPDSVITFENNQFIADTDTKKRVVAKLLSVDFLVDGDDPFSFFDEQYSASVNTVELSLNGFPAKKYHMQTVSDGAVSVFSNTIYYCIQLDSRMVTFAYYPILGFGGLHTEDIETVLDTIRPNWVENPETENGID